MGMPVLPILGLSLSLKRSELRISKEHLDQKEVMVHLSLMVIETVAEAT